MPLDWSKFQLKFFRDPMNTFPKDPFPPDQEGITWRRQTAEECEEYIRAVQNLQIWRMSDGLEPEEWEEPEMYGETEFVYTLLRLTDEGFKVSFSKTPLGYLIHLSKSVHKTQAVIEKVALREQLQQTLLSAEHELKFWIKQNT